MENACSPPELPSGGDRVAWVSERILSEIVLNVQVDDPLVGHDMIDPLVAAFSNQDTQLALLAKRIDKQKKYALLDIVKIVFPTRQGACTVLQPITDTPLKGTAERSLHT